MRVLNGVLIGLAGLALAGAAQAQGYGGYYRYYGPGPGTYAPYPYEPPPAYFMPPPPPPRYYEPPPYYGYAEPDEDYGYYAPPLPRPRYRAAPDNNYAPPPPRQRPPASATQQQPPARTKTASATPKTGPVSCTKAEDIVAGYGFGNVKPVTCEGKIFGFSALRDGKTYRVQVSAATGEITEVRKQP